MKIKKMLLKNNFINVPVFLGEGEKATKEELATVLSNFSYYGFVPSKSIVEKLMKSSKDELASFWKDKEAELLSFFDNLKKMKEGVVYKNFPEEVLNKSEIEYWLPQILMYIGVSKDFFVQEEKEREKQDNVVMSLTVLQETDDQTLSKIYNNLLSKKVALTLEEQEDVLLLSDVLNINEINISTIPFKMNGVFIANFIYSRNGVVKTKNLTDLFRFAASIGAPEKNINNRINFFKFSRSQRKQILKMFLNLDLNLFDSDVASRRESFKALFKSLRAGDFKWAKPVSELYDRLYNNEVKSIRAKVFLNNDINFDLLKKHHGVFMRMFHEIYNKSAKMAVVNMLETLPSFDTYQLLKFQKYIKEINNIPLLFAKAHSRWDKSVLIENDKIEILLEDQTVLDEKINQILSERLNTIFPNGVLKGDGLDNIKLSSNDQEIGVGRGTIKKIPLDANYIRTGVMWSGKNHLNNIWFDNSWNFIHKNEELKDSAVCWDNVKTDLAVFSGDPTTGNYGNIGSQLIDVDLNKLKENNIKYAVWNVLCFSHIPFSKGDEVFACAQFLADQNKGELLEPANVDIQFDLKGNTLNKMVLLIDVEKREIVYLDVAFPKIDVSTANNNLKEIRDMIIPFIDNLKFIPSVEDLIKNAKEGEVPFLVSDKNIDIKTKEAFVFEHVNSNNEFKQIDLQGILDGK